jgi:hypothetical protein
VAWTDTYVVGAASRAVQCPRARESLDHLDVHLRVSAGRGKGAIMEMQRDVVGQWEVK